VRERLGRALLVALGLAGCAPGLGTYDKPGLTYAEWRRDDAECREASRRNAGPDREAYARCLRERGYRVRGE
jgi:hypothetical protein